MRTVLPFALLLLSGCAILNRSDKFGADFELSTGGILEYIVPIKLSASIGFSKTCFHEEGNHAKGTAYGGAADPPYL